MQPLSDDKVIDSWRRNAKPWSLAVRQRQIESRRLVTDRAIVDAVVRLDPRRVLDLGCGEGWLSRSFTASGMQVTGVDAVAELVDAAREAGGGVHDFRVLSYEEIVGGALSLQVDAAVANFSLIGQGAVDALVHYVPALLAPGGHLIVQTLHPATAKGNLPYVEGWRAGSWDGFADTFTDPAPWYFRTLEGWVSLLNAAGFRLCELREPVHPITGNPASLLLVAGLACTQCPRPT